MENFIEKLKGLDKKVKIGIGAGAAAVVILIIALVLIFGGDKPANTDTENTQEGTEVVNDVFVPEGDGSEENPFIMAGTEFDAVVPAEGKVYYQMYKVNGMVLTIEDEAAYVIYGDTEYKAENGVVSVPLVTPDTYTPASFAIGNTATDEKTFKVKLVFPQGTQGNPIVLDLGEFAASVAAGNDQGVYYTYTATETGTFTVSLLGVTEGIAYDFSLYNLNTYAMRTLSTEGATDADGNKAVSIEVNAGDVVQISVGTLPDAQNEYPAGEFKLAAAFVAGAGSTDSTESTESTEANTNNAGTNNTEKKEVTYSVTVKDEKGKAISGALVTVGDSYGKTNSSGTVSFTLVEDNYTATAEGPSGYASVSKAFGSSTSITITLKKASGSGSSNDKSYTVNVVDYAGNPLKDAAVSFVSGGKIKTVVVGSNGAATASLPAATYNVQIKFPDGKDYGFDKSTATVSASKTSTTVVAAAKISSSSATTFYNGEKTAYNITSGAVYTGIQANANNYFIFTPSTSGKYRIKTTNSAAKVAHVGNEFYINENPAYSGNQFTADISDDMIGGSFVISVTGASECVLIVERYGSVGATIKPTNYNGSGNVPSGYATPGNVTYVDVTGSGISLVKGSDGYYHKDSASGPIVYVDLHNTKTIDMTQLVERTAFLRYFYTSSGSIQKIEDYTTLMTKYTVQAAKTGGFVPLTDDMIYMIQNGGQHRGWWDKSVEGGFYLFEGKNINKSIAWMFLLCY